jgi:hypothetical protein
MQILVAFAPFLAFAVVDRMAGSLAGLVAGALLLLGREALLRKHSPKILDIGTTILFCGLSVYFGAVQPSWSVIAVRLVVDSGLIIVLISLAVGKPFTLQYAREKVSTELWDRPEFRKINYVISSVWAFAFAVMVLAEATILFAPQVPRACRNYCHRARAGGSREVHRLVSRAGAESGLTLAV